MPETDPKPHSPTPHPHPPKRASTFTTSTNPSDLAPSSTSTTRFRGPRRQSSAQSLTSSHSRSPAPPTQPLDRRSSTFSLTSIDELGQTLTEDIINPSFTRVREAKEEDEVTNWHSTPLLFALLPAVGGVLFKEGAAVVTDLLILGLAAIFLNWSVRLPWDWYYAAQVLVREARGREMDREEGEEDVILEEERGDEEGEASEQTAQGDARTERTEGLLQRQEEALAGLHTQETLALLSTFLFPALAAYLLHFLRGQLSTPSTGLVSDYNLAIFLLVAEIRPFRQLIRLTKRRTLHLQRTVTGNDDSSERDSDAPSKSVVTGLTSRIEELERRLQDQSESEMNGHTAKKSQVDELSAEMKKRYESRIDALERAVRRYEKRTTTLAMVTEQRLKAIDTRLSDTLSLAAVAAQQSSQRSAAGKVLDTLLAIVVLPLRLVEFVIMWPVKVLEDLYARVSDLLFGKRKVRRSGDKRAGETRGEKTREKVAVRKVDVPR